MTNVIQFPGNKNSSATKKPAGMVDLFPEQHGMVLLDGCIPAALLPEILRLMTTAGVRIRNNAA
jgi:hypothetical protein